MKVNTDGVLLGASVTILPSDTRMLDIGTGTGTIALMAAQRHPSAQITAIDIDASSALEAAANFAASPWADRLESIHTPLQNFTPDETFSLIFSNPPFYDDSLKNPDGRSAIARHCIELSLYDIARFAGRHLDDNGRLALILPSDREGTLMRECRGQGLFPARIVRIRTVPRKAPSRIITEFSRIRSEISEESLTIQDAGEYTPEYKSLTGDFYLF